MGKLLRLRDYALVAAAIGGEIFEEMRLVGGFLPAVMQSQYGFVPKRYKRASYLATVSKMISTGDISREVDKKGRVYLVLTSVGKGEFERRFPLLALRSRRWDGLFMVVIFDIPEEQRVVRHGLRIKLTELGFGMLQKSVWISPYHFEEDLREYLVENGLKDQVFVLRARRLWLGNKTRMAERVWKLKKINRGYEKVIETLDKVIVQGKGKPAPAAVKKAYVLYLDTLATDPLLPKELLPSYWARGQAIDFLNEVMKSPGKQNK